MDWMGLGSSLIMVLHLMTGGTYTGQDTGSSTKLHDSLLLTCPIPRAGTDDLILGERGQKFYHLGVELYRAIKLLEVYLNSPLAVLCLLQQIA